MAAWAALPSDQKSGATILEQQHHRPGVLQPHQLTPPQPYRSRPQAGVLQPGGECRSGWHLLAANAGKLPRVEHHAMETGRIYHGLQARVHLVTVGTDMTGDAFLRRTTLIPGIGSGNPMRAVDAQAERRPAQYLHERFSCILGI